MKKVGWVLIGIFLVILCALFFIPRNIPISGHAVSNSENNFPGLLKVSPDNPFYFVRADNGKAVYLSGSHYWYVLQDVKHGVASKISVDAYLSVLRSSNQNFARLWMFEGGEGCKCSSNKFSPLPIVKSGGNYIVNQAYLDRVVAFVDAANKSGIYVSVMFFQGWSVDNHGEDPWPYNCFNGAGCTASTCHKLSHNNALNLQKQYISQLIDRINNYDNVLYEISNEDLAATLSWQTELVNYIHAYEATKPKQHPVGMTGYNKGISNSDLLNGPADWISPAGSGYKSGPPVVTGTKVVLLDTDHIWGIGGNGLWIWQSFLRGYNPIYMDDFKVVTNDARSARIAMGETVSYANKMNLKEMTPQGILSSTGYCLASIGKEYLALQPSSGAFNLNLAKGNYSVEWFNINKHSISTGTDVITGGAILPFTPPASGPFIIYLKNKDVIYKINNSIANSNITINATNISSTPNTEQNIPIVIPILNDNDKDGITNDRDLCSETPIRSSVNSNGCLTPRWDNFKKTYKRTSDSTTAIDLQISNDKAAIIFKEQVNLQREEGQLNLDNYLTLEQNKIILDSANLPELNVPALLVFQNVNAINPKISIDGKKCEECNILSYDNEVLVVEVSHFSTYEVVEEEFYNTLPTQNPVSLNTNSEINTTLNETGVLNETFENILINDSDTNQTIYENNSKNEQVGSEESQDSLIKPPRDYSWIYLVLILLGLIASLFFLWKNIKQKKVEENKNARKFSTSSPARPPVFRR